MPEPSLSLYSLQGHGNVRCSKLLHDCSELFSKDRASKVPSSPTKFRQIRIADYDRDVRLRL